MINCTWDNGKTVKLRHVTVDALVFKNDKLLLIKRAGSSLREPGKYALPGGFLDLDETPTEAVMRELLEETGYKAKIATLFRVIANPNRRNTETQEVDFAFIVEVEEEKVSEPDCEVAEVVWLKLRSLPEPEHFAFDHFEIIQLYMDYLKQKFYLPIFDI